MFGELRQRQFEVLLVEDDDDDAAFITAALLRVLPARQVHRVVGVEDALDFLHHEGAHPESPRPDLVLLDLHLPGLGGYAVLDGIKKDATLHSMPVVVLSNSDDEAEVRACYAARANSYVRKPEDSVEFDALIEAVRMYWLSTVLLPPR